MKVKYYYFLTPSVYLLISYLCLTTKPFHNPIDFSWFTLIGIDKVVHSLLYFLLTLTTNFVLLKMGYAKRRWLVFIWAILIPILFSGFVEIAQAEWVTGRSGEWADFFANTIGSLTGFVLFKLLFGRLSSK